MEEILRKTCSQAIGELFGHFPDPKAIGLERTKKEIGGDFTLVVFPFTRFSRMSPEQTATLVGEYMVAHLKEVATFQAIKGFLNLTLTDIFWIDFLTEHGTDSSFGLQPVKHASAPVILEYSSPNTNKPLHLGHVRNNLLGYSIALILEANGFRVEKINLVNDRGIHICKSMVAYMKWGEGKTPRDAGIKGDHFVGQFYVSFETAYRSEIKTLMKQGMTEDDAAREADLMKEAQEILRQWEAGDPDILDLWKTMNGWTYDGFDQTYNQMGVAFDTIQYESDTYLLGKELVREGVEQGVLISRPDGSIWIDLSGDNMDEKLLLRADGTSVYMTQDLGTAVTRYDTYLPSKLIYVVGNEQVYHFDVLKIVLKKLGKPASDLIYHLSYGMVELPDGRMKSREGTVVDADDLMGEMIQTAEKLTRALGKANEFDETEAANLFSMIGLGALKYFILKVDPRKNMLFNPEESIDFNGNTGPFIQYTHARIQSLLHKANQWARVAPEPLNAALSSYPLLPVERQMIKLLHYYPTVVRLAGEELSPALVANYIYDLAKEYNQFYQEVPVLREENQSVVSLRLALTRATGMVIREGMRLLGISVPDRM